MRTLLVVLELLAADGGTASASRPAAYAEARREFTRAFRARAFDAARLSLARARTLAPGRGDLGYDLACLEAQAGNADAAVAELGRAGGLGLAVDPAADPDLAPLRADPRWPALLARFSAARDAVEPRSGPLEVPAALELAEDLAEDPRTGALLVSSVRTGTVWRRLGARWQAWAHPAPPGSGAFALGVDSRRGLLHVAVAAVPHAEGFTVAAAGTSALVTLRLEDGTEVARAVPPGPGPHLLGDLAVAPDGTVLVSDARAGTVYRLAPGSGRLQPIVPEHTFASPQTPALVAGGRLLLVPDWTLGLVGVPVGGGTPEPVTGPEDLVTAGIDGLAVVPGGVLAVQNGIVRPRIVRLWLSEDARRVTRWEVLARGAFLGEPTHVVTGRQGGLALIDSGWDRFGDDGALRKDAHPARPRLLPLDLR